MVINIPDQQSMDMIQKQDEAELKLTPVAIKLRDDFIDEYLKDFNYEAAAVRIGLMPHDSSIFRICPYVQNCIAQHKPNEISNELTPQAVINRVWEEANDKVNGTAASRSMNLARLMEYFKLIKKEDLTINNTQVNAVQNINFDEATIKKAREIQNEFLKDY